MPTFSGESQMIRALVGFLNSVCVSFGAFRLFADAVFLNQIIYRFDYPSRPLKYSARNREINEPRNRFRDASST